MEPGSRNEVVSSQLDANITGPGEHFANRANAREKEVINLWAQHATDVATPQRVVNKQAEDQRQITGGLSVQMAIIIQKLASVQPTPTPTIPAPLPTQVPADAQIATSPDRVPAWAQERQAQNASEQGRQVKGKQLEGGPPRSGNLGDGNQDPPTPPKDNDPDPSDDGSNPGGGGGGGGNPG